MADSSSMADSWDVYVAFCQRRGDAPLHWMLLLANPGSMRCTWYHVVGGPTQNRDYERKIQAGKRIDSFGISRKQYIGHISASEINKVKSAVVAVPVQECQRWTVEVLAGLERKCLIPSGTSVDYYNQMEPAQVEETEDDWVLLSGTFDEMIIDETGTRVGKDERGGRLSAFGYSNRGPGEFMEKVLVNYGIW
ncbi:unnamed protein product [Penicillium glandicola]